MDYYRSELTLDFNMCISACMISRVVVDFLSTKMFFCGAFHCGSFYLHLGLVFLVYLFYANRHQLMICEG